MIKVISATGGGIRGVISAIVLAEIEKRAGKPIAQISDLICGTSTGSLIACGLTMPSKEDPTKPLYSAQDIVNLYEREGKKIFSNSFISRLRKLRPLHEPKYSANNIEDVLRRYFGNAKLSETLCNVLISSYEIEKRFAFFFKSSKARKDKTYDFYLRDICRSSSAAPTYFKPHNISDKYFLIDGAMASVNNPAMCGYVEALCNCKEDKDVLVISLGTGSLNKPYKYSQAKGWGVVEWGLPALSILLDGSSSTVDHQLSSILPENRYFQFQGELLPGSEALDNTSEANMERLKEIAFKIIEDNNERLDELVKLLTL